MNVLQQNIMSLGEKFGTFSEITGGIFPFLGNSFLPLLEAEKSHKFPV
jgi:hypothetical protein